MTQDFFNLMMEFAMKFPNCKIFYSEQITFENAVINFDRRHIVFKSEPWNAEDEIDKDDLI